MENTGENNIGIEKSNEIIPDIIIDEYGDPTEEYLKFLRDFKGEIDIMDLIKLIFDNWNHGSMGYRLSKKYKGKYKLELHTLGCSFNEQIIREIIRNVYLTDFYMKYYQWRTGGHYYFEIPVR